MSSTHMSPGKRKGCTAYARYAMSMKQRKGRAPVAPAWTPWIVSGGTQELRQSIRLPGA